MKVANMHCEGCINTIKKNLKKEAPGLTFNKADLDSKIVEITYPEEEISEEGIKERLNEIGYKAVKIYSRSNPAFLASPDYV